MSIMQQSSKAQDRTLGLWFHNIQQGMLKLPRFQRLEAWDRGRITSFLNTIINNLPVGVTLALEVRGSEQFESHYIASSNPEPAGPVTELLLDGQQRLTAFWRSMHDNYERETYFVVIPQFDQEEKEIRCIPRWFNAKKNIRMPRWADEPSQCFQRGFLPVSILRPGDISTEIDRWLSDAMKSLYPQEDDPNMLAMFKAYNERRDEIKGEIYTLRERLTHFNLPYLLLPAETSKHVALQVFINMNTNSKPLSQYDIVVAEVEKVAGKSLRALEASLKDKCPKAGRYGNVPDLILSTSALLQEKLPNTRGMIEMDKRQLLENWPKLERGLERMASFLEEQGVFDEARLPTNAVLAVIAATYELIPEDGDFLAKAEKLLRRYLWSAFFTDRYENSAPTRAFADFKAIKVLLKKPDFTENELITVPVLNRSDFPLADADSLMAAGWPKGVGIEARAILTVTNYLGAIDFADNKVATYDNIQKREYHHVFPDALLLEAEIPSYLALNCALITWKTNRLIGRKNPLDYLKERVEWADESIVQHRLKSHLISYGLLTKADYTNIEGFIFKDKLTKDFNEFLLDRAKLVVSAIKSLTDGNNLSLDTLWKEHLDANNADKAEATL